MLVYQRVYCMSHCGHEYRRVAIQSCHMAMDQNHGSIRTGDQVPWSKHPVWYMVIPSIQFFCDEYIYICMYTIYIGTYIYTIIYIYIYNIYI